MYDRKEVLVQLEDGTIEKCFIDILRTDNWKILFSSASFGPWDFMGDDLFEALFALRESLERLNCKLLCNGSRADVAPSGMSKQMGGGRKAYIVRLGCPARRSDIVDIFDYAEPDLVSTAGEQKKFYGKWVESLK